MLTIAMRTRVSRDFHSFLDSARSDTLNSNRLPSSLFPLSKFSRILSKQGKEVTRLEKVLYSKQYERREVESGKIRRVS